jgi:hypothetical protein
VADGPAGVRRALAGAGRRAPAGGGGGVVRRVGRD